MNGFKSSINLITGILVFVAFLLLNLLAVEFAPQSFLDVLLNSGLMMVCWILIRNAFAEQGLISGQKDPEVKATKKEHLVTSNEISTYKSDFNIWCEQKNAERLKERRVAILSGSSLIYEDYFDEHGNYINKSVPLPIHSDNKKTNRASDIRYKKDIKLLNKARFAYVPPYEAEEITAKENYTSKKKLFGLSVKQWKSIKIVTSVAMSLIISIMLSFVQTSGKMLTQDMILIIVFEMLLMAGSAFAFYFSASNFICGEWREGLIRKIRIMEEFYRNVVGTISYENDVQNSDGSLVLGKKVFTKSPDYKPLVRENENKVKGFNVACMDVAPAECAEQKDDPVCYDSGNDIQEPGNSDGDFSVNYQSVILDDCKCNFDILGGSFYSSGSVTDSTGNSVEEDMHGNDEQAEEEK